MGMNLVTTGLGNYMATAVVNIVNAITAPSEFDGVHAEEIFRLRTFGSFEPLESTGLKPPQGSPCQCTQIVCLFCTLLCATNLETNMK